PIAATPDHRDEAEAARRLIIDHCRELQAPLTILEPAQVECLDYQLSGQTFRFAGEVYHTRLLGLFQPLNAALALSACTSLVDPQAMIDGIRETRWPARLEVFPGSCQRPWSSQRSWSWQSPKSLPSSGPVQDVLSVQENVPVDESWEPLILIDGAHNPQGCLALGDALDRLLPGQPIVFLVGLLSDKDYPAMLGALWAGRQFKTLDIICVTPENPRALPAKSLAKSVAELKIDLHSGYNDRDMIHTIDQPELGLAQAVAIASTQRAAVCAFGSLYLVGQLRTWIRNRPRRLREDPQF
ncbi:MAG: folylpolyglutamate synthase, partial [Firmicutes bacterium]|nr:folylpolyglutamate synthase [Bacillota bacterium]